MTIPSFTTNRPDPNCMMRLSPGLSGRRFSFVCSTGAMRSRRIYRWADCRRLAVYVWKRSINANGVRRWQDSLGFLVERYRKPQSTIGLSWSFGSVISRSGPQRRSLAATENSALRHPFPRVRNTLGATAMARQQVVPASPQTCVVSSALPAGELDVGQRCWVIGADDRGCQPHLRLRFN